MPPKQGDSKEGLLKRSRRLFGNRPLHVSRASANGDLKCAEHNGECPSAKALLKKRKETYLKSLEQEVVNLRQQHKKEARRYEAEITSLKSIIIENGLPLPQQAPHIRSEDVSSASGSPMITVNVTSEAAAGPSMQMDWSSSPEFLDPGQNTGSPEAHSFMALSDNSMEAMSAPSNFLQASYPASSWHSQGSMPAAYQQHPSFSGGPFEAPSSAPQQQQHVSRAPNNNLTDAQLGIDFVLA
ncbi:MAG: hypothetical protein M1828_004552 [Chrysothrix sp. TS-e1954]|nr:MAG: hypothetical protein M1828_004552 [Chrysothrix sp. TS-e1954]